MDDTLPAETHQPTIRDWSRRGGSVRVVVDLPIAQDDATAETVLQNYRKHFANLSAVQQVTEEVVDPSPQETEGESPSLIQLIVLFAKYVKAKRAIQLTQEQLIKLQTRVACITPSLREERRERCRAKRKHGLTRRKVRKLERARLEALKRKRRSRSSRELAALAAA